MAAVDPRDAIFDDISTPALVVSVYALDRNIRAMAKSSAAAGMALRPHAKTHKCIEIARRQIAAGAAGIACATVSEAEHLAANGLNNLLVTAPIASPDKAQRLARLSSDCRLTAVVDHPDQVALLGAAMASIDASLALLVDIDVGQCRTGVTEIPIGVELARRIASTPKLVFSGIQGFAGQAQHIIREVERSSCASTVADRLTAFSTALAAIGLAPSIVSGSGTGTSRYDLAGPYTELQVGSYVFMDADYGRLEDKSMGRLCYENSLFILATVVSVNRPDQVTVDAGTKALAFNGPTPRIILGAPTGTKYRFAGDEHGVLELPGPGAPPAHGSRVLIEASHCDPTINLYSRYHAVEAAKITHWEIGARYV